jgi:hypothetical protein
LIYAKDHEERPRLIAEGPSAPYKTSEAILDAEVPAADPDRFFDLSYMDDLRQIVQDILARQAPIPLRNLGQAVAHRHGWQRTGRRIMQRVEKTLGGAEVYDEFGVSFVWAPGTHKNRIEFRGLLDRSIQDVSRTEIAAVLDEIGVDLSASDDPIGDLARHMGINRVSSSAREYLLCVQNWYDDRFGGL